MCTSYLRNGHLVPTGGTEFKVGDVVCRTARRAARTATRPARTAATEAWFISGDAGYVVTDTDTFNPDLHTSAAGPREHRLPRERHHVADEAPDHLQLIGPLRDRLAQQSHIRHRVTALLAAWTEGDMGALERLVPLVYTDLRRIAARRIPRGEPRAHALGHGARARVLHAPGGPALRALANRAQFFAIASSRCAAILVDHARKRQAHKRHGGVQSPSTRASPTRPRATLDLLELDDAMQELSALDERSSKVVEMQVLRRPLDRGGSVRPRHLARHGRARVGLGAGPGCSGTSRAPDPARGVSAVCRH